jgi:hypothetical protein
MTLFTKYKNYIDLANLWKIGDKFLIPGPPNFKMIENDEWAIMDVYKKHDINIKLQENYRHIQYIAYTEDSIITARTNATIMFHSMLDDKYINTDIDNVFLAQKRYIEISYANTRILNLLKITFEDSCRENINMKKYMVL